MANAKKKDTTPGVFDVSRPGKSAPSASSKPIIVTNRPMLQDPMMAKDEPSAETVDQPAKPGAKTIQPITITTPDDGDTQLSVKTSKPAAQAPVAEEKPAETAEQPAPAEPEVQERAPEATQPEEKPADTPPVPEAPAEVPATEPATDVPAEKPATNEEEQTKAPATPEEQDAAAKKAEEEAAAHTAAIQKLVDEQQYFLPINSVESRKTKRFILLGVVLILLLGAAWVDISLDAGLLHISGVKAVTHFFTK